MTGNQTLDSYILIALGLLAIALKFLGAIYLLLTGLATIFANTKAGPFFARWGADLRKVLKAVGKDPEEPEAGKAAKPPVLPLLCGLVVMFVLTAGCAALKPIARTADDIAHQLCALHYAEAEGLSLEEAGTKFCQTEAAIRPWLELVLRTQRVGTATPVPECEQPSEKTVLIVVRSDDAGPVTDAGAP